MYLQSHQRHLLTLVTFLEELIFPIPPPFVSISLTAHKVYAAGRQAACISLIRQKWVASNHKITRPCPLAPLLKFSLMNVKIIANAPTEQKI